MYAPSSQRKSHPAQASFSGPVGSENEGLSQTPPAFSLTAGPVAQRQEDPQQPNGQQADGSQSDGQQTGDAQSDGQQADPFANLPDAYRDPISNSNTSYQNIQLLIQQWELEDGNQDDRKLAYILATANLETAATMQGIHEGFSDTYWKSNYADSGYWGRGFVQLTWERNYRGMEDATGVDLTQYKEAALLPAISSIVTVDGMMDGDFTGVGLDRYFTYKEGEDGEQEEDKSDWYNARRIVNGTDSAQKIGDSAENILASIRAYRTGVENGSITGKSLAEYLYNDTTLFTVAREADANRMLEALGYQNFGAPGFGDDRTDPQEDYQQDVRATGYAWYIKRLNSTSERNALRAFQTEFNQNHNLETPLRQDGVLDDATFEALMRTGNQIKSGENMIDYAFGGEVEAINPVTQAFDQFQGGQTDMPTLAATLASFMPVPDANEVLGMMDQLGTRAADLAFELALAAPGHNDLAYFNPGLLSRMQTLLSAHSDPRYVVMGQRVQALQHYAPAQGQHIEYAVQRGDSLGRIASNHNTSLADLLAYNAQHGNAISDPNRIEIGQLILFPNPDYDPQAQGNATLATQENFPLPRVQTGGGSSGQGSGSTGGQSSGGQTSGGQTSGGQSTGGQTSGGQTTGGQTTGGQSSGGQTSGGKGNGGQNQTLLQRFWTWVKGLFGA